MNARPISPRLLQFFKEEVKDDENATLRTALDRLNWLRDSETEDDRVAEVERWLLETEELIAVHGEHCSLRELAYRKPTP